VTHVTLASGQRCCTVIPMDNDIDGWLEAAYEQRTEVEDDFSDVEPWDDYDEWDGPFDEDES
jgi:hypothetical protein